MKNPLDGVTPDFSVFGTEFTSMWLKLAAGLWGIGMLIAIGYLGHGILAIAQSRNDAHPMALRHSKTEVVNASAALGGLIALPVIVTAFFTIFG